MLNVSEVEGEVDYESTMKEFGIETFNSKLSDFILYRRGIVFGQRDFSLIQNDISNKKPFAVLSGFNPSAPLHMGNLFFLKQALYLQKHGAHVFIPISNDETHVFKKGDIEDATSRSHDVINDIIALGFKPKHTHIFISSKDPRVYELAIKLSTRVTFSTIKSIFGFTNESNPGQIFYSMVQTSHILLPQLFGIKHVVVPIGIDQDPYIRLSRDVAEKVGFSKPSSTYHKFLPGLQGGKMSGSKPQTCIYINDDPAAARKKIMGAFSGGAATLKEQREKGGNPEIDVACQYLKFMFEEDDKKLNEIFQSYRTGSIMSGDVKNYLADKVEKFLVDHKKSKEKVKSKDHASFALPS